MPKFSKRSLDNLATCEVRLQKLFEEVIKDIDCMVICGHRGEKEQNEAFAKGSSKLKWPNSMHNTTPSLAVDVVPYPLEWNNIDSFTRLMRTVKLKAKILNIPIECGGDWKKLRDFPHYQLTTK